MPYAKAKDGFTNTASLKFKIANTNYTNRYGTHGKIYAKVGVKILGYYSNSWFYVQRGNTKFWIQQNKVSYLKITEPKGNKYRYCNTTLTATIVNYGKGSHNITFSGQKSTGKGKVGVLKNNYSKNQRIATLDLINPGKARIDAIYKYNGQNSISTATNLKILPVKLILDGGSSIRVVRKKTKQLSTGIVPLNNNKKTLKVDKSRWNFKSSNKKAITINSKGKITAEKYGMSTISITYRALTKKYTAIVTDEDGAFTNGLPGSGFVKKFGFYPKCSARIPPPQHLPCSR